MTNRALALARVGALGCALVAAACDLRAPDETGDGESVTSALITCPPGTRRRCEFKPDVRRVECECIPLPGPRAPRLAVTVEPTEGGSVVYLPLAAPRAGAAAQALLSLQLGLVSAEASTLVVNRVTVAFPSPPGVSSRSYNANLTLAAGATGRWTFTSTADNILMPDPPPAAVVVSVFCQGFPQPVVVTRPLAPHVSPVPGRAFGFPSYSSQLAAGEYWVGASGAHAAAGDGSQLFAYDMMVTAFDAARGLGGSWSELFPGTDGDVNGEYRAFGKPVHAVAEGTVVAFEDGHPENTTPSPSGFLGTQPLCGNPRTPGCVPVEGNHFYVQSGTELLLYAHLQPGSLPAAFMTVGARVRKGEQLGLVGNTGNSSRPHLHVHSRRGTAPWTGPDRPYPYRNIRVIDQRALPAPGPTGPWVSVGGRGLPPVWSNIWPSFTDPAFRPLVIGISRSGDWANQFVVGLALGPFLVETQRLFDRQGLRLVDVTTYVDGGVRKWAGVARSGDWANRFVAGLTESAFLVETQRLFDQQGLRLVDIDTYEENGVRKWAGISRSGDWANWLLVGRTTDAFITETQRLFDQQGLRLIKAITYVEGGVRKWAGIARSGDWASRFLAGMDTDPFNRETQRLFDEEGLRLIDATSYVESGVRKWAGIARSGDWATRVLVRPDLDRFIDETQQFFDQSGLRLSHVEILDR